MVVDSVQGTDGGGDYLRRHRGVTGCSVDPSVSEQRLDDAYVGAVFQQVGGEGVAQSVDGHALSDAGTQGGFAAGQLQRGGTQMLVRAPGGKQVNLWTEGAPIAAQRLQ